MKLGDLLKKEREKRRLSPKIIAEQLGISENQYLAIEAGGRPRLDSKRLLEWAERFGISLEELDDYRQLIMPDLRG